MNITWRQGYIIPIQDSSAHDPFTGIERSLMVLEADRFRHENPFLLDARLAYSPTLGPVELELGVDFFNILNSAVVLQQWRFANLDSFGEPTEILGPRFIRFGARVTF